MYLSSVTGLVGMAALFQHRESLKRGVSLVVVAVMVLSVLLPLRLASIVVKIAAGKHQLLLQRRTGTDLQRRWCDTHGPLTSGVCFLPEEDRVRTMEFVMSHSKPGQTFYVGVPHHDVTYASDDLLYFGVQRMPATKWYEFNPLVQNDAVIQQEMVNELEKNRPPLVVLDAEFETTSEPNASSVSTGVRYMDEYLERQYVPVATFGVYSILQRR
jgi:hypothetical protein